MSFKDHLVKGPDGIPRPKRTQTKHPKGWEPHVTEEGRSATVVTPPRDDDPDHETLLRDSGLDPDTWLITTEIQVRRWQQTEEGPWLRYFKFNCQRRTAFEDPGWDDACKRVLKHKPRAPEKRPVRKARVICLSDWQTGLGENGGTEALVARVEELISDATEIVKAERPDAVYIAGLGDMIENCDNYYCVSTDTPVLTKDLRWVPAGDLKPGDGLYSFDEDSQGPRGRRFQPAEVVSHEIKRLPTMRVTLENGEELTCTPEHPWLCYADRGMDGVVKNQQRWVMAKDLVPGHQIAKPFDTWQREETYDAGWFGGILDGEGYFTSGKTRSAPNILGVSQLPGPVLDKMKRVLDERGFHYQERMHPDSGVATLLIQGGISEIYRALGTFRPNRLISKVGYPYMRLVPERRIKVVSVEEIEDQEIAVMGTSARTFIAAGYMAHNSMQTFNVDLDRRGQVRFVRRALLALVKAIAPFTPRIVLTCVPGNHGENRKDGKAYTTFADNDDVAVFEMVAEILAEAPAYRHVSWVIPDADLTVTLDIAGTIVSFAHGHQFAGGSTPQQKAVNWWKGQALGRHGPGDAHVLVSGHYHHWQVLATFGRLWLQCPSLDNGSQWFTNQTGDWSLPGTLTFTVGEDGPGDIQLIAQRTTAP